MDADTTIKLAARIDWSGRVVACALLAFAAGSAAATDRAAARTKEIERARQFFAGPTVRVYEGTHFTVISDAGTDDTVRRVAQNLEATYDLLSSRWGATPAGKPGSPKVTALVYRARAGFDQVRQITGLPEFADGLYSRNGWMAFHIEKASVALIASTMIHEAVHSFFDHFVVPHGTRLPLWIEEGFASYIAAGEIRNGSLEVGSHERFLATHDASWDSKMENPAKSAARRVKSAFKTGTAVVTRDLLALDAKGFYDGDVILHYDEALLLVHMLSDDGDGEKGSGVTRFSELLSRVAEGEPSAQAIKVIYGLESDELEKWFRSYVKYF